MVRRPSRSRTGVEENWRYWAVFVTCCQTHGTGRTHSDGVGTGQTHSDGVGTGRTHSDRGRHGTDTLSGGRHGTDTLRWGPYGTHTLRWGPYGTDILRWGRHGTDTLRWGPARDGHAQMGGRCQTQSYGSRRGNNQIGSMTDISKTGYGFILM